LKRDKKVWAVKDNIMGTIIISKISLT